ncbi:MAG: Peptidase, partial [Candidatus Saccharibacteria bacterium]|nr:Peptidase [Candidatus Saccharibacteria bacterium]
MSADDRDKSIDEGRLGSDELGDAEDAAANPQSSSADNSESDQLGGGYRNEENKGMAGLAKKVLLRRNVAGGGIIGSIVVAGFTFFGIIQGPMQIVHVGKWLEKTHLATNQDFMDGRSARYMYYFLKGNTERARLGALGNVMADKWEARMLDKAGMKPVYQPTTGRFIGYEVVDEEKAQEHLADMETDSINTNARLSDVPGLQGSSRFVDLRDARFADRRSVIRTMTRSTGTSRVSSALGSRLLIHRAGVDFHPFKNVVRKAGDNLAAYNEKRKEERAERRQAGAEPPGANAPQPGQVDTNGDGKVDAPASADAEAAAEGQKTLDGVRNARSAGDLDVIKFDIGKKLLGGAAGAVSTLCMVKGVGDEVQASQFKNVTLVMVRMAWEIVSAGSQIMFGKVDLNMDEIGSLASDMYDPKTKTNIMAAASIQAASGRKPTGPDIPPGIKPSAINEKPLLFKVIDSIKGMDTTCAIDAAIGNLPIIKQVGQITSFAIDAALKPWGISQQTLADSLIDMLDGSPVDKFARGGPLGAIVDTGMMIGASQNWLPAGAVQLTSAQAKALRTDAASNYQYEHSQKSLMARTFDPYDIDSVAGRAIQAAPSSPSTAIASLVSSPFSIFSSFKSLPFQKVSAAETYDYDYGVPMYGYSLDEINDPRFADPFANAEKVEANDGKTLEKLNEDYGVPCFGMQVDPKTGNLISGEAIDTRTIPDKCVNNKDEMFIRYRFYLSDKITEFSLSCYEGDAESCAQIVGGASSTTEGPAQANVGVTSDGFVFPLKTTKETITSQPDDNRWCYKDAVSCHPNYKAADIHAPAGTPVLAARGGKVVVAENNAPGKETTIVTIKGVDGLVYTYTHMGIGSIEVKKGQTIPAGTQIGKVGMGFREGTNEPSSHVHLDVLPATFSERPECSPVET